MLSVRATFPITEPASEKTESKTITPKDRPSASLTSRKKKKQGRDKYFFDYDKDVEAQGGEMDTLGGGCFFPFFSVAKFQFF